MRFDRKKVGRALLYLPCRHHILEIVLKDVFMKHLGSTTGPDVELFKSFRNFWLEIKTEPYECGMSDDTVAASLSATKSEILSFSKEQLKVRIIIDIQRSKSMAKWQIKKLFKLRYIRILKIEKIEVICRKYVFKNAIGMIKHADQLTCVFQNNF